MDKLITSIVFITEGDQLKKIRKTKIKILNQVNLNKFYYK